MLTPLSWLKEFVDIKLPIKDLAWKLSEAGLTVEKWTQVEGDTILDPEITPNRPDWMSICGISREIAAVTNTKLRLPDTRYKIASKIKNPLPIIIKPNYSIVPRITSVTIRNVKVKPSSELLQKRIRQIGLRPINNLVDITNYVLWQYGGLLHAFDYDKIRGHQMTVDQARGGEDFRSLDGIDYKLPKGAIIIKDVGRVIDLLPLKGGDNTASTVDTRNVLLHSVVVDPIITRRTSQALGLRSDSSAIAERGLDPNSTLVALETALKLILDVCGGEVASEIIDHKEKDFNPWTVDLRHERLEQILGIRVPPKNVVNILERLELKTTMKKFNNETMYTVTIPTFRNDLHIEEDLIEEVGRLYGYNNFPKNLPQGAPPTQSVAYAKNYDFENQVKQILKGAGYSEIYTYSLISEKQLTNLGIDPGKTLRVDNPISRDYEYLRPHLLGNLLEAAKLNLPNFPRVKLFELGKIYQGENLDKKVERYQLGSVLSGSNFLTTKGDVELILATLSIKAQFILPDPKTPNLWLHPGRMASIMVGEQRIGMIAEVHPSLLTKFGIKERITEWTLTYDQLEQLANPTKKYQPIPKYPPVIEDLSLLIPDKILHGDVIDTIKKTSHLINSIELLDVHEESKTLRLTYQDPQRNLTDKDVAQIRSKILTNLKENLGVRPNEK